MKKFVLLFLVCILFIAEMALCGGPLIDQGNTVLNPRTGEVHPKGPLIDQGSTILNPHTGEVHPKINNPPENFIDQGDTSFNPRRGQPQAIIDHSNKKNKNEGVIPSDIKKKMLNKDIKEGKLPPDNIKKYIEEKVKQASSFEDEKKNTYNHESEKGKFYNPSTYSSKTESYEHQKANAKFSMGDIPAFQGDSLIIDGKCFLKTPEGFVNINTGQYFEAQGSFSKNVSHIRDVLSRTIKTPNKNPKEVIANVKSMYPALFSDK